MWCFDWLRQLSIDEWLNEWLNDEWLSFMADRINTIAHHDLDSLERNMSALREYNTLWKLAHREFKTSWSSLQDFRKSKWVTKGLWRFLPIVSSPLEVRRLRPRLYSLTPKFFHSLFYSRTYSAKIIIHFDQNETSRYQTQEGLFCSWGRSHFVT